MTTPTRPIITDPMAEKRLAEEGYVVIPFLNNEEVDGLCDFYYAHHTAAHEGMYATAHTPDLALRLAMNNEIRQKLERASAQSFKDYNILGGSYIAKGKGSRGTLNPHQDWNIVDEDQYRSFNIWIPLVDLHPDNGAIMIMPGSHTWLKTYRSANINSAFSAVNEKLWQEMQPLYMKRGEALVYDHRLLHASGENKTDTLRLTVVAGMIPSGAQMYYYHKAGDNRIEVYESNPEFFLLGNIFEGPKGLKKLDTLEFAFPQMDLTELSRLIDPYAKAPERPTFLERLRNLF